MKERPILFSAPMVRALLDGSKTQTRRVVKRGISDVTDAYRHPALCPHGQPGDRLWVREAHWWFKDEHDPVTGYFPPKLTAEDVQYRADGDDDCKVWRPSIHMPRWASRISLEITSVRVERMHNISETDAVAEGIQAVARGIWWKNYTYPNGFNGKPTLIVGYRTAKESYRSLWESINVTGSWVANPWVWVIEFRRLKP